MIAGIGMLFVAYVGGLISALIVAGICNGGKVADLGAEITRLRNSLREVLYTRDPEARERAEWLLNHPES